MLGEQCSIAKCIIAKKMNYHFCFSHRQSTKTATTATTTSTTTIKMRIQRFTPPELIESSEPMQ
jgi:hypothetical protein